MEFWASSESEKNASDDLERARNCVEPYLNSAFANSSLAWLNCKIRYIPIVMPEKLRSWYPARSKLRRKQNLYDCAPQLNYDLFVDGKFEDQLREYLRGIGECAPHLAKFGASPDQIEEFEAILLNAVDQIMKERPDQTRH